MGILDPVRLFDHLAREGVPDVSHLLPELLPPSLMAFLRKELPNTWNSSLDLSAKIQLARRIVQGGRHSAEGNSEEEAEGEEGEWPGGSRPFTPAVPTTQSPPTTRPARPSPWATSKRWPLRGIPFCLLQIQKAKSFQCLHIFASWTNTH